MIRFKKNKNIKLFFLIILIAFLLNILFAINISQAADNSEPRFKIPEFQVKIPTVNLSEVKCVTDPQGNTECSVPWIAEYIQGIYRYSIGIAGILAAVVLMAGGLIWLISAGNASRISQAKSLISGSLIGLMLLIGSYLILNQINPELTTFKPLKIGTIEPILNEPSESIAAGTLDANCILQTYGSTEAEVRSQLVTINFLGKNVSVHAKTKEAFEAVNQEIINSTNYRTQPNGTFNWRYVSGKTQTLSLHSFGIAIDLEPVKNNDYYSKKCRNGKCSYAILGISYSCTAEEWCSPTPPTPWTSYQEPACMTDIPEEVVNIFKKHGFDWGGDWKSSCDAMHFEWHGLCTK